MRLRQSGLLWQDLDGEVVVLDLETSTYLRLNESGGVLWHELARDCSREDLTAALVSAFEISEKQARDDIDTFLRDLADFGFLR